MKGLGVFIDLSKAFDTVNHNILLSKLELYGIGGFAQKLICSYLTNRTQVVTIDGISSDPMEITCGVPQGSILGPLFFILYINDLPQALHHSNPLMFADDTTILTLNKDIHELRKLSQQDLNSLSIWCKLNLLTINYSKTAYLLLSSAHTHIPDTLPTDNLPPDPPVTTKSSTKTSRNKCGSVTTETQIRTEITKQTLSTTHTVITHTVTTITPNETSLFKTDPYSLTTNSNPLNMTIDGNHIEMEEKTKFLGIIINENVKWQQHVQLVVKKISKYIGIFCKLRYYCPLRILIQLYYALIYSHFIYCLEIWGSSDTKSTYLQPLLIIQKKILRIITFSNYRSHAYHYLKNCKSCTYMIFTNLESHYSLINISTH
eukprot:Lithocolla_globosa_v1_NODE_479_length_3945_cov_27.737018.p2 type:complete len:374 gc:universal NODE_479_length_3945_cov_27.737018:2311-3432(+)